MNAYTCLMFSFRSLARALSSATGARPLSELDHSKAYNSHRLERDFGGVWSDYAVDARGYQDHYCVMPDGSVWRPRKAHQYYTLASGKLMMVCVSRCEAQS